MPRSTLAALVALLAAGPALAQDDGPMGRDDIMALAADKNIKLKQDKLIGAIEASEFDWSFEDVYTLVDMDHPPEVVKPAAGNWLERNMRDGDRYIEAPTIAEHFQDPGGNDG